MFNKNYDLLGEQLAESGLEMNLLPATALLIGTAVSAGTSILGGIFGASQADKANAQAEKSYNNQMKAAQKAKLPSQ